MLGQTNGKQAGCHAAEVDLIIQSNEGELVSYLNFCEGKAHLGLIENKEVRAKLVENGFLDGYIVKRFVRRLMPIVRYGTSGALAIKKNVLTVRDCGPDFAIEIRGFDVRRELITNVKGFRDA